MGKVHEKQEPKRGADRGRGHQESVQGACQACRRALPAPGLWDSYFARLRFGRQAVRPVPRSILDRKNNVYQVCSSSTFYSAITHENGSGEIFFGKIVIYHCKIGCHASYFRAFIHSSTVCTHFMRICYKVIMRGKITKS